MVLFNAATLVVRKSTAFLVAFSLLSILIASLLMGAVAHADAEGVEITISPTTTRLELSAGQTYEGKLTVLNSGSEGFDFKVYAAPYQAQNERYDPDFTNEIARTQISRWVSFDQVDYRLEPRESIEIPYVISVPESIPDGGQYGAIFAETTGEGATGGQASITSQKRVGTLLYASTDGNTIEEGSLLSSNAGFMYAQLPITLNQRIENKGNTDFIVNTVVRVSNIFGRTLHTQSKENTVLPGSVRATTQQVTEGVFPAGLYKLTAETTFLGKTTVSTHWVLLAPLWAVVILIGIIVVIIWGIRRVVSKPRRKTRH